MCANFDFRSAIFVSFTSLDGLRISFYCFGWVIQFDCRKKVLPWKVKEILLVGATEGFLDTVVDDYVVPFLVKID